MRNVFIVLGIVAILVIVWMLWIATPDNTSPAGGVNQTEEELTVEEPVSFTGRVVCLPHKNTELSHTDECRFGIATVGGTNYALDTENMDNGLPEDFDEQEEMVRITGLLDWSQTASVYDIAGLLRATLIESADRDLEESQAETAGTEQ